MSLNQDNIPHSTDLEYNLTNQMDVPNEMQLNANEISCFVETVRLDQHPEDEPSRRKSDEAALDLHQAQQRAVKQY